jgi:hypothetical protein
LNKATFNRRLFVSKKKTQKNQDSPDACIRAVAEEMQKDKWEVKADLPGFEKPKEIGSFRPQILANKKGCMSRICEVVTEEMFEGDKQRYLEVKNYCDEYDFHMYVVDKDGKRREIDPTTLSKKTPEPSDSSV